jgi:phosphoribosylanthranilate isomerase
MKIKVCGMKNPENIEAVLQSEPDFMGFIFYEKSPRYVGNGLDVSTIAFKENTQKIGVFVNSTIDTVLETVKTHNLDFVQLHGDETIDYVKELFSKKIKIVKAFQITENFNWSELTQFADYVSYFLFDRATKNYGGSGLKFDWEQLEKYNEKIPFFLSGGIKINDIQEINKLNLPLLYGIDINSKFESAPGVKNIGLIKTMINQVRHE